MNKPTDKQLKVIEKLKERHGKYLEEYFYKHFPKGNFVDMSKEQAQKLINALGHTVAKPIYGVYGRDVF